MRCMEEKVLERYLYVCPHCFNKLKECECTIYPESLIQIDKNLFPIIKTLNRKGYKTINSCEGHIGTSEEIYIMFKKNYKFKVQLPKGIDNKNGVIVAQILGETNLSKTRKKNKLLRELNKWADSLENIHIQLFANRKE